MASFRYKAVDEAGAEVAGMLVADTPEDARARLRQMRLFPERIEPMARSAGRWSDRLPGLRLRQAAARGDLDSSIVNILLSVISASAPAPALTPSAERELSPVVRDSR